MNDFEQYIRETEPHRREKGEAWQTAIGLQAVDGLKPSAYLVQTAKQHIEGDITIEEAKHLIDSTTNPKPYALTIQKNVLKKLTKSLLVSLNCSQSQLLAFPQ